jgi:hypothetical protein
LQNVQGEVPLANNNTVLQAVDQGIIRSLNKLMEVPSSQTAAKIEVSMTTATDHLALML